MFWNNGSMSGSRCGSIEMQVRYSGIVATIRWKRPLVELVLLAVVIALCFRPSDSLLRWIFLAIGIAGIAWDTAKQWTKARRAQAMSDQAILDFRDYTFFYGQPPEEISYAEILTYYVEQRSYDDYELPRFFLTIEFRNRPKISFNVKDLDRDPQEVVAFLARKMNTLFPAHE